MHCRAASTEKSTQVRIVLQDKYREIKLKEGDVELMKTVFKPIIFVLITICVACSGGTVSNRGSSVNPRDTVRVPEGISGEDSIAYIENTIIQSPISASDLLDLAEIHTVENWLYYYNNFELVEEDHDMAETCIATHSDSVAMRLANRFMRMSHLVNLNGDANDMLQWALAVDMAIDSICLKEPTLSHDSALNEISFVINKFSSLTQSEMNFQCYVDASVDFYRTIEAYRNWLSDVPDGLKPMAQEEYEAWFDLHNARFAFWHDVSFTQTWYSMKPMEIEGYYENLSCNRRAELEVERDIVLERKPYQQKGKTVTTAQWEKWITEHSMPDDVEMLRDAELEKYIPEDSVVVDRVNSLKSSFSRWLKARQAFVAALPKEQGISYDNLTADIHCRMIDKLPLLIPLQ
jgi:hypothetical protein